MPDATLDPTPLSTGWSPGSLLQELESLVDAALAMQGSALVVAAQPALAPTWEVQDRAQALILSHAREAQLTARKHVDYCLSVIYPSVVSVVAECRGATNLLETVSTQLPNAQPDDAGAVEEAVRDALRDCQIAVEDLGDDVRRDAAKVAGPLAATLAAMNALVAEVDDDGWLAQTSKDLDAVRSDIQKDIAGIYAWRTAFGDSLSGIVESLTKLVRGAPKDKKSDDPKKDDPKKDDAKKDDTKNTDPKKTDEATKGDPKNEEKEPVSEPSVKSAGVAPAASFAAGASPPAKEKSESVGLDVKKINFIADQVAGLREQIDALHEHYDRLARLYLDLAEEHDVLAMGRAVIDQVQMLVDATSRTASSAEALGTTWGTILGAAPGSTAGIIEHQLEWRRVQRRLTKLERALAS